nr:winged helix-turn-helix domain-containing protein [Enterococcus lactis]
MELSLDLDSLLFYKALSAETRLIILDKLAQKPQTSSELAQQMNLSKAIISRHLKVLEEASLISLLELSEVEEDNRKKIYSLSVDKIEIHFPQQIYLPYKKRATRLLWVIFRIFLCSLLAD